MNIFFDKKIKMYGDLLGLIFTYLQQKDQVQLSQCSSFIFQSPLMNITKLSNTERLTQEILEKKSIITNDYLWKDLLLLNTDNCDSSTVDLTPICENLQILLAPNVPINQASLEKLQKIKVLYMTEITSIPPLMAKTIEILILVHGSDIPSLEGEFPRIKTLNGNYNSDLKFISLSICDNLEVLYAEGYSGINQAVISNLKRLKKLYISDNDKITSLPLTIVDTLEVLYAAKNCGLNQESIISLKRLRILDASNNPKIHSVIHLSESLEILYADDNCGINQAGITGDFKRLKKLHIYDNNNIISVDHLLGTLTQLLTFEDKPIRGFSF